MASKTEVKGCDCTKPYSYGIEGGEGPSRVDAYGHPLCGCRSVFRCLHGREMEWDPAAGRYRVKYLSYFAATESESPEQGPQDLGARSPRRAPALDVDAPSSRLVAFTLWGAASKLGLSGGKVRVAAGQSAIARVVARLERDSGLVCCGGPRSEGTALERGRPVADHWAVTLGQRCHGGGFTPEGEVWIAIQREG